MKHLKRTVMLLLVLFFLPGGMASLADEEVYYADLPLIPTISILTPKAGDEVTEGKLIVTAKGGNVSRIEVTLSWDVGSLSQSQDGEAFDYTFELPAFSSGLTIIARGYAKAIGGQAEQYAEATYHVPSPKEEIIDRMIKLAYLNSKDSRYKFAPAQTDYDIGVCKNFVMRLFDTYAKEYAMQAYPDLPMHMPKNNSKKACAPYDYGIEWHPETAADGSPFEIVAQFKYNKDLSKEENAQIAFNMLSQVQKGDFFQMVGYYGGGNGPHSLFFIQDYNPATHMLHWTDSNMRGTRINGVRWGYLQYDADATAEWFIECINTTRRGATLYRLRDDLIRK